MPRRSAATQFDCTIRQRQVLSRARRASHRAPPTPHSLNQSRRFPRTRPTTTDDATAAGSAHESPRCVDAPQHQRPTARNTQVSTRKTRSDRRRHGHGRTRSTARGCPASRNHVSSILGQPRSGTENCQQERSQSRSASVVLRRGDPADRTCTTRRQRSSHFRARGCATSSGQESRAPAGSTTRARVRPQLSPRFAPGLRPITV